MKKASVFDLFSADTPAIRKLSLAIVLFAVVMLVVLWGSLQVMIHSEQETVIQEAYKETGNFAKVFAEHTVRTIRSADQEALFIKYQYELEGKAPDLARLIASAHMESLLFVQYSIINKDGLLIASSEPSFNQVDMSDREHFSVHREVDTGRLYISKPVLGRVSGKWSIQMTRRLNQPDGSFAGVVVVSVDPFYFTEFYRRVDLGESGTVTLVGLDGNILARESGNKSQVGQELKGSILLEKLSESDRGHFVSISRVDGIKRFYGYQKLASFPLAIVVGMGEEEVLADLNARVNTYYLWAVLITGVLVVVKTGLLVALARQKQSDLALMAANTQLEGRIARRTEELMAINQELSAMNLEYNAINKELADTNADLREKIAERDLAQAELHLKNEELNLACCDLQSAQSQAIQQEKMASIGQLASGVAHEINNPLGFIFSNFETLQKYVGRLAELMKSCRTLHSKILTGDHPALAAEAAEIAQEMQEKKVEYILEDFGAIFTETMDGLNRVRDIVKALRLFSRMDNQAKMEEYNLNQGVRASLLVAKNEIKYVATVKECFGQLPVIQAVGGQINQVILNVLINAAYAIKEKHSEGLGEITVSTTADDHFVYCTIADNGIGMTPEVQNKIYNPFFTTKPVGQGTGLGLSLSFDMVVNRHHGEILVNSQVGVGTTFIIKLPKEQPGKNGS